MSEQGVIIITPWSEGNITNLLELGTRMDTFVISLTRVYLVACATCAIYTFMM